LYTKSLRGGENHISTYDTFEVAESCEGREVGLVRLCERAKGRKGEREKGRKSERASLGGGLNI